VEVLLQQQSFGHCWKGVQSCQSVDEVVGSNDILEILNAISLMFETFLEMRPNSLNELAKTCSLCQIDKLLELLLLSLNSSFNVVVDFLLYVLLITPDYFVRAQALFG
jgi:hypothetical protein